MARLVDSVLETARLEGGAPPRSPDVVDLAVLVDAVVARQRPGAAGHQVAVNTTAAGPFLARVRPEEMERVLSHLLSNALTYAPPGSGITVELGLHGTSVRLSVSDAGPGIPSEEQEAVFTQFYRAADRERAALGGGGLGLHLSRRLVERHGGQLWIESAPGQGTNVYVDLPRAEQPA